MIGRVITVVRLRGIPVRVHLSWLVIVGLITWSLSVGYFPQLLPGLPLATHWAQGFLAALLLFVSVFLRREWGSSRPGPTELRSLRSSLRPQRASTLCAL